MSLTVDPTLRNLNDCGCCEGITAQTPVEITNLPGLTAIAYRVGTHAQFRQSMLARLSASDLPALRDLTTRNDDDFTISLLDAWATVADVLTFYQERVANESYLRTATERVSILHLARLIGYELRPGVAASTYLAFTLENAPSVPQEITIDIGTKVQSIPGQDEQPQIFETIEKIKARAEWNEIKPQLTQPQPLSTDVSSILLQGTATNLKQGDGLLIVVGTNRAFRRISSVEVDREAQQTSINLEEASDTSGQATAQSLCEDGVYAFGVHASLFGFNAPDWNLLSDTVRKQYVQAHGGTIPPIIPPDWPFDPPPQNQLNLDAVYSQIVPKSWVVATRDDTIVVIGCVLKTIETGASSFGLSSKITQLTLDIASGETAPEPVPLYHLHGKDHFYTISDDERDKFEKKGYTYEEIACYVFGSQVPGTVPLYRLYNGQTHFYTISDDERDKFEKKGYTYEEIACYVFGSQALGTVPLYRLQGNDYFYTISETERENAIIGGYADDGTACYVLSSMSELRRTTVYAQSEKLTLAELPIAPIQGHVIELDRQYEGLKPGQVIIVSGACIDSPCEEATEVAILSDILVDSAGSRTILTLTGDLKHVYKPETVEINANIARATHGETVQEVLGSGDTSQPYQRFTMRQPPLTYISAPTPSGAESTLQVRVNDLLWHEVPTLYGCSPGDRIYVTRTDDDGKTTVQFGDGQTGMRLSTGQENVRATYRKGIGLAGNVDADKLSLLMTRPLGVKSVTNPLAANGAADRESLGDARHNSPLTVLTLDRVVSLQDYEDFARAFAGIAKALATWTWDGQTRDVFVTVAGPDGAGIAPDSDLYKNLLSAMQKFGDPYIRIRVESYRKALFRLAVRVKVNQDYRSEQVLSAVEQSLRSHFSFEARDFGQPITLSEVMEIVQAVPGVQAADVDLLYRLGDAAKLSPVLVAAAPQAGARAAVSAAELLTLDPAALDGLGVML